MAASLSAGIVVFRKMLLGAELAIASAFMIAMVTAIIIQVVARFVFSVGLTWTDEVAAFSFVWSALLGAAIALETRSVHVIDFFVARMPALVRRGVRVAVYLFVLATLATLIVSGLEIVEVVSRQRSSVLDLRMSYVYAAMPVSAGLMMLSMLLSLRHHLAPDHAAADYPGPDQAVPGIGRDLADG